MIKFNQPRYILPLIVLPFIYVFFYLFQGEPLGKDTGLLEETSSVNPSIPDPFLDRLDQMDKFDAFLDSHKNKRDFSAIREIDNREEITEQKTVPDSVPVAKTIQALPEPQNIYSRMPISRTQNNSIRKEAVVRNSNPEETDYEKQMRLFKAQMNYMDSLFASPAASEERDGDEPITRRGKADSEELPHLKRSDMNFVGKKKDKHSGHFNTLVPAQKEYLIKAMIDEELTVVKGSRVRIRLTEEVLIGERVIEKNQYLYGLVTSFKPQRIDIHIHSVLVEGSILEIGLEVYDTDGMQGLFIPKSGFREITKDLTGNLVQGQNINMNTNPGNGMELMYGMAKDALQTTSRAASKAIKKNKAVLKYGTIVYLVNTQKEHTSKPQTL